MGNGGWYYIPCSIVPALTASRDYYFPIDLGYGFFSSSCVVILFSFSCLWCKLEFGEGLGVGTNLSKKKKKNCHSTLFDKWIIMKREACLITRKIYHKITMSADEHNKMVDIMFHILSGPVVNSFVLDIFQVGQVHAPRSSGWLVSSVHLYCLWNKELPNTQTNHIDQAESDWASSFTNLTLSHVQIWCLGNDILHDSLWTGKSLRAYHGNQLARACYYLDTSYSAEVREWLTS